MDALISSIVTGVEANCSTLLSLKKVFWGDPIIVGKSDLPAVAVYPSQTQVLPFDTSRDDSTYSIGISVMVDAKEFLNKNKSEASGYKQLVQMMEERDTDQSPKAGTVLEFVRNSIDNMEDVMQVQNIRIDYGVRERGDSVVLEAILECDVVVEHIF